ncbi:bifunctional glutamate N-acetyltransferase/amino-acid acetyltransferase ArgJ [Brachyspira hampsonii]|uniref:Arginine biosynthesis bifunctional protein ArgJ n=1 Tax=Brachyspira hampsonii TaxID=1287055 RepID=A0AAC9XJI2_9SPIR|nr:bifunctional glutamate N-acetyltransferase/amino-acid acetyltransferase ArgJ [Brachyspira hampsonii]ASJ20233.1 bifunctional ornithine acetyltransferase/N-acetylglutamate synthase [Brachyspira hampsonii]ELV06233.1 arginine biosynthesis bifunctional protein ArgJ [Brachyspira hampsonii 30599]MBW5380483.1 bifunctional glutamate N-acetyltransferase/amino-acid acetyltransferase ArgJ [Brachyspira hampsonii]MBW5409287.1 bifunctional glutamate N-acetyltransferase/amino-acid acetyltransferase ArgJ [Br
MTNIKQIEGGVCAAKGFKANGIHAGIKKNSEKKDLAIIYSESLCSVGAVYTQNKVCGANIIVSKEHLKDGKAKAVICNSGNANTCNKDGVEKAKEMCKLTADVLGIDEKDVAVASTGVIGVPLNIEPIQKNIKELMNNANHSAEHAKNAASAIMTTDTFMKEIAYEFEIDGKKVHIGGTSKGSGMIHPNMATMLAFLTTDCSITSEMLQKALSEDVKSTYNMISVDGDTSTNDMCVVLANGEAENTLIDKEDDNYKIFCKALNMANTYLSRQMAKDGEGATKLIECEVINASDIKLARKIAKSVITSNLVKAAMFGCDMNWGRISCAIGYTEDADFDINKVSINVGSKYGEMNVYKDGYGVEFSEEEALKILKEDEIRITINMNCGTSKAVAWGCDLTYDYVKINGSYRS